MAILDRRSKMATKEARWTGQSPGFCRIPTLSLYNMSLSKRKKQYAQRMIWQHRGHASFEDWGREHPAEEQLYRRAVLLIASQMERRFSHFLEAPFVFTAFADERCTIAYRRKVAKTGSRVFVLATFLSLCRAFELPLASMAFSNRVF